VGPGPVGAVAPKTNMYVVCGGKSEAGTSLRVLLFSRVSVILTTTPYSYFHEVNSSLYNAVNNYE
jgi:hypothetical protein